MAKFGVRVSILCICIIPFLPALCHRPPKLEKARAQSPLPEVARILGQSSLMHINRTETQLCPMYTALPKTSDGALLKDCVPSHVFDLVKQQLGGRGFGLHELAVLATTLDDVILNEVIEKFVANTPSGTVDAPRNLSVEVLGRLNEIAGQKDGNVPLHGRIFARWLHHAYPRECPFPQPPGSSSAPMTPAEWVKDSEGATPTLSLEKKERLVNLSSEGSSDDIAFPAELPFPEEEELVMIHEEPATHGSNVLRNFACFAVLSSALISVYQTAKSALARLPLAREYYLAACGLSDLC